jgi:putative transposase
MSQWCIKYQVQTWAYGLMPNHIHLIVVPETKDGLKPAIKLVFGEAHRRYTRRINFREGWRGHLWQGRFPSLIMEEEYVLACTRYVELNPVRAGLVKKPEDWRWSSAGRLLGSDFFIEKMERLLDRKLRPKKPGPKKKDK